MYAIIAPDRIANVRNDARHTATTGTLVMRLRDRLMEPLKRRADREMAALLEQIGHPGLVEDFRQSCRQR
jgi:hypothetical protein